ncbi:hypothetical protein B0H14DRAFT_3424314 [Mycena olivaceomarginata]|nr:hypothetical protein B0H14DRAFT_3424314 [Mycena olivaceomarginata]
MPSITPATLQDKHAPMNEEIEVVVSHQSHREPPGGSNGMRCGVATTFCGSAGG